MGFLLWTCDRGWKAAPTIALIMLNAPIPGLLFGDVLAEFGAEDHHYIARLKYQEALGIALGVPRLLANINSMPRSLGESSSNWIPKANVLRPLK